MTTWRLDRNRLVYGLRTATGASVALGLAWAAGLEHPQWAGMTVWAASQPIRAQLVEKSVFRGIGTLIGALFGVLLTATAARSGDLAIVTGVALWVGLCASAGTLMRGFASYGAHLAGYTAVMVALLDSDSPENVVALGIDRSATVLTGVLVALAIGLTLTPHGAEAEIPRRLRLAGAGILHALAARLREPAVGSPVQSESIRILRELAAIDDEVDGEAMGSLAARREARRRREMLVAQVGAILWLGTAPAPPDPARAEAIEAAALLYDAHAPAPERRVAVARAARGAEPGLRRVLTGLAAALPRQDEEPAPEWTPEPLVLHRDWTTAREAGVRAAATLLAIGGVWLATGWSGGPMVMLGAAVMILVFSTSDDPFPILPKVAAGQALGAAMALACRWLVWPHLGGEAELLLAMLPFIFLGAFLTGFPRLQVQSFDYNMVVLLLLQPAWPLTGSLAHSVAVGVAVASAPFVALLAFRLIYRPSPARRRAALVGAMVREVEAMAGGTGAARRAPVWRARMHHRLLRLVRYSERAGSGTSEAAAGGLALLLAGRAVLVLEAQLAEPDLPDSSRRRLRLARARCAALGRAPERAAATLAAAARLRGRDTAVLSAAAAAIRANAAFLASASPPPSPPPATGAYRAARP